MENYKEFKGYSVHKDTKDSVCEALRDANIYRQRVKITYKDGFGEVGGYSNVMEEVFCYIGKSTGTTPIFLDIRRKNSSGGCGILTQCISKIEVLK